MLASPSIQEIASALARSAPRPTIRSASRVLCLRLQDPALKRRRSWDAIAEAFLKFSPRVQYREIHSGSGASPQSAIDSAKAGVLPARAIWLFIDIASTSHLFHGEEGLMQSAMNLARDLGLGVQCACADTPAGAQAFAMAHQESVPPGEERERLKDLSLPALLNLEGLEPWKRPSAVESVVTFFMMLGFKTAGDLSRFTLASLQERWGEVGELLWKRLNAQDRQPISPMVPTTPLEDYVHLDFPVSLVSLLLHQAQKSLDFLFCRLQGRRLFAQKLVLTLHCEYSKTQHRIEIEPNTPCRDRELFVTLLEHRLSALDLENPIRDFEMSIVPCPEKTQQLDFFEPRTTDSDKLQTLMNLLTQSSLKPGFYQIEPSVLPERSWQLVANRSAQYESTAAEMVRPQMTRAMKTMMNALPLEEGEEFVTPEPWYGEAAMKAPRPTRLLREPQPLSLDELQRLKILSRNPIERLEGLWWEDDFKRDYYFAVSSEGQCLWIFQDLRTEEYFLHGYFD